MALSYNTVVRLGNVKWGKDYKNVMMFDTVAQQHAFFVEHLKHEYTGLAVVQPDTYIDLDVSFDTAYKYNYCIYRDDSNNGKEWFFNFINKAEALSNTTTRFYISTDIWQQFHLNCDYTNTSFIERCHVAVSDDTVGRWLSPEPVSAPITQKQFISEILTADEWRPQWVLHATSKFNETTDKYEYQGTGSGTTLTSERGFYVDTPTDIEKIVKSYGRKSIEEMLQDAKSSISWQDILNSFLSGGTSVSSYNALLSGSTSIAELQDHRNELIGIYAIPQWAKQGNEATNTLTTKNGVSVSVNNNTLAGGYTPKNKKLLTSVCGKKYLIYNRLGLNIELAPELLDNSSNIVFNLSASPLGTQSYALHIDNYKDVSRNYHIINYSAQTRVGYDANTGLDKTLNSLSASVKTLTSISATASSVVSGNPTAVLNSINSDVETFKSVVNALGQQGTTIGGFGDLISISGGRPVLRVAVTSPTNREAEFLDDYLNTYGYAVNELLSVKKYLKTRPNFNYIKTNGIELSISGNAENENAYKSIFNSGVTVWHNYSVFGNTNINNR